MEPSGISLAKDCASARSVADRIGTNKAWRKQHRNARAARRSLPGGFFAAAAEIPVPHRGEVIKAAQAVTRDELKIAREKATTAKAKAKKSVGKATGTTKAAAKTVKTTSARTKSPAKRA
jgi:hypothetical protein